MLITMRNRVYKLDTRDCDYDVKVDKEENVLVLSRGELVYLTVNLNLMCLGSKLALFELFEIKLKEIE